MEPIGQKNFSWAILNPFKDKIPGETKSAVEKDITNDPNKVELDAQGKPIKSSNSGEGDDPLLKFESLWQPNKDAEGKDIVDPEKPQGYLPKLDNKKLNDLVNKVNFTDGITGEELEALKAGGENAVGAMINMVNRAGRKAFTLSLGASSRLAEQGLTTAQGRFLGEVPNHVRNQLTDSELSGSVGIMNNPAFTPVVESVKQQYLKKFPKAGPKELNSAVTQYFDYLAKEHTKKPESENDSSKSNTSRLKAGDPNADFMKWIESEIPGPSSVFNDNSDDSQNQ